MNATNIEWATRTWNPVTGCMHGCDYCFARRYANRFKGDLFANASYADTNCGHVFFWDASGMQLLHEISEPVRDSQGRIISFPFNFAPTLHRHRLGEPAAARKPQNVFVTDMGDLFGVWVPPMWTEEVFRACRVAPQHNYLFLTKNPRRYSDPHIAACLMALEEKGKFWFGASATDTGAASEALKCLGNTPARAHTFLSVEPLMGEITLAVTLLKAYCNWVIVGAMTGRGAAAHQPRREWVQAIVDQCQEAGVPVFLKNNLAAIWGGELIQEMPEGLRRAAEVRRI